MAEMLKRQDRGEGRNRTWRSNFNRLQKQLLQLEEDEVALDAVFPQVGRQQGVTVRVEGKLVEGKQVEGKQVEGKQVEGKLVEGKLAEGNVWVASLCVWRQAAMGLRLHVSGRGQLDGGTGIQVRWEQAKAGISSISIESEHHLPSACSHTLL